MNKKPLFTLQQLTRIGLMAALVFASNYMFFPVGHTRIHLGNIFMLLSGFFLGGLHGGLAAGVGASLFDLLSPGGMYIASAPTTFIFRFAMAFTAGTISRMAGKQARNVTLNIVAAVTAALLYMVLHMSKSFVSTYMLGSTIEAAFVMALEKGRASTINALIGICASVPISLLPLPFRKQ